MGAVIAVGLTALILPMHTPGARYSKVTQATVGKTICVKGWTDTLRPPASYTNALKKAQLTQWGYVDQCPGHYEEDHLISLELGGAPRSKEEPLAGAVAAGAPKRPARERLAQEGLQPGR